MLLVIKRFDEQIPLVTHSLTGYEHSVIAFQHDLNNELFWER